MFEIRKADVRQCKELAEIHSTGFLLPWDQSALRGFIEDKTVLAYVAIKPQDQSVTGFILTRSLFEDADILTLAVAPKCQKNGIGYGLCHASMRYLAGHGVQKVHLEVSTQNKKAVKLYQKLGFHSVGTRKNYYSCGTNVPREDALRMTLDIKSALYQFEPASYLIGQF